MHTKPIIVLGASLLLLLACPTAAHSAPNPDNTAAGGAAPPAGLRADPYVPPEKRIASTEAPASGLALRQQALRKLRLRFEEADLDANGSLTLEEAQRAQLGFVAENFASIDQAGSGKVSFKDLATFLELRRAAAGAVSK